MEDLTFEHFDKFQRKNFAIRLTKVISAFYPLYDEAFVLGLNAKFGSGKTTFLKMWEHHLKIENYRVIYINAWETDFDDEPIIPIVSSILNSIKNGKGLKNLKSALHATLGTAALVGNNILGQVTSVNIREIAQEVEKDIKSNDIEAIGEELYKEFSYKKKAYDTLKEALSRYVEMITQGPLIIFVDELDRVRPNYAVKLLETIKHLFSIKGVCFVLAVDRKQIETSVRQLYGDIDFENYYRRFITREADLPDTQEIDLIPFVHSKISMFFGGNTNVDLVFPVKEGLVFPFKASDEQSILRFICCVCTAFKFVPREIDSFLRILSQFMAISKVEKIGRKNWIEASVILIAISIGNKSLYEKMGKATASPKEIYDYLKSFDIAPPHYESGNRRRLILAAMAFSLRSEQPDEQREILDIAIEFDLGENKEDSIETKRKYALQKLTSAVDNWEEINRQSVFQKIYVLIEGWKKFIDTSVD